MANVKIPLSKIKKIDVLVESGTGAQIYKKYKPDYMINLALWDFKTGKNIQYVEDENEKSGYLFGNEGIGIKGKKELCWVTRDTAFNSDEIRDFCSGSPTLVKNGVKFVNWGNKVGSHANGKHLRSFIGFDDNYLTLVASDSALSIDSTVTTALNLGMKFAINVDGGGSCHLQDGAKVLKKSIRKNASWLLVYLDKKKANDPVPKPATPTLDVNMIYVVQKGDTLYQIGKKLGIDYKKIAKDNDIKLVSKIKVGQKLFINK